MTAVLQFQGLTARIGQKAGALSSSLSFGCNCR